MARRRQPWWRRAFGREGGGQEPGVYRGIALKVGRQHGEPISTHRAANFHGNELLGQYDLSIGHDLRQAGFHLNQVVYARDPRTGQTHGPFRLSDPSFDVKGARTRTIEFRHRELGNLFDGRQVEIIPSGLPDLPHPAVDNPIRVPRGYRPPTGAPPVAPAPPAPAFRPAPTPAPRTEVYTSRPGGGGELIPYQAPTPTRIGPISNVLAAPTPTPAAMANVTPPPSNIRWPLGAPPAEIAARGSLYNQPYALPSGEPGIALSPESLVTPSVPIQNIGVPGPAPGGGGGGLYNVPEPTATPSYAPSGFGGAGPAGGGLGYSSPEASQISPAQTGEFFPAYTETPGARQSPSWNVTPEGFLYPTGTNMPVGTGISQVSTELGATATPAFLPYTEVSGAGGAPVGLPSEKPGYFSNISGTYIDPNDPASWVTSPVTGEPIPVQSWTGGPVGSSTPPSQAYEAPPSSSTSRAYNAPVVTASTEFGAGTNIPISNVGVAQNAPYQGIFPFLNNIPWYARIGASMIPFIGPFVGAALGVGQLINVGSKIIHGILANQAAGGGGGGFGTSILDPSTLQTPYVPIYNQGVLAGVPPSSGGGFGGGFGGDGGSLVPEIMGALAGGGISPSGTSLANLAFRQRALNQMGSMAMGPSGQQYYGASRFGPSSSYTGGTGLYSAFDYGGIAPGGIGDPGIGGLLGGGGGGPFGGFSGPLLL
jgi:hypothetical protein